MTIEPAPTPETCLAIARRSDPDRFLTALFAPPGGRDAVCVLIAFNHELVRAVEMPSAQSGAGPIATLIRLQWWREVVEGSRGDWRHHEVAEPLHRLIDSGALSSTTLLRLIDARESDAEGLSDLEAWRVSLLNGAGALQQAIGEALHVDPALSDRLSEVGAAYAIGALARHLAEMLRVGRCTLPDDLLAVAGTTREALLLDPGPDLLARLRPVLVQEGIGFLGRAGRFHLPRDRIAAALPLVLAARDLGRAATSSTQVQRSGQRGIGDRVAVLASYATGRAGRPSLVPELNR
ncbi:squalene/phytoene synthase family protein [Lichenicola cladoniae]|uniref:Squalene/phytoene synthase family protein n=1 Tax=Lichenicola cladoniae TaxID=1484109 RepID=A0A6M8HQ46_9PROT|nr:squalene/phytoene synthase family protein [Lichenicola cladoniae]NPD66399.1 squalene/phytoene synthase family protein [Acetobacteraceae bacterium]QKE90361.1 squalene/phytoene synthase family protein [Lichenicola cladoniae]